MSNSPAAYLEDGRLVIRASSLDRCQRCLVGLALGFTPMSPPEKAVAVFQRGHRVEDEVIAHLRLNGWYIRGQQDTIELEIGSSAVIRGHLDGKTIAGQSGRAVLEIKSCAPTSWDAWTGGRWEAWDKWEWQTSVYGHATGLPVVVVAAQVIDGQWTGQLDFFTIPEPRIPLSRIHARVLDIQRYVDEGRLPATCSSNDWPCPLYHLCSHPEVPPDIDPALDALAVVLDKARAEEKKQRGLVDEARKQIDRVLGEREKVRTDSWLITRTDPRKTLDEAKVAEALGLPNLNDYKWAKGQGSVKVTKRKDGGRGDIEASAGSVGAADTGTHISPRDGGEREDGSGDGDRRPVAADGSDEDLLHPRDGSQPGSGTVPRDDPLASEER